METVVKTRLSDQFTALALECEQEVLTVRELLAAMGVRGHAFIVLFFSVPFCLPIPLPGLSMVLGLLVMISGLGISFGFNVWLPAWAMRRSLPGRLLARAFRAGAGLMRKLEKIIRPRFMCVAESPVVRVTVGFLVAISGFLLALPLPPGTNFPPASVSLLLALGILEKDALFLLAGFASFFLQIAAIVGLLIYAKPWLMQWL